MIFRESQSINKPWALYAATLFIVFIGIFLYVESRSLLNLVPFVLLTAFALCFFYLCRFDTEVSSVGIKYRFRPFHLSDRFIEWKDIRHLYVRTYHPFWEYKGWGIQWGKAGQAYTINGNKGMQLILKNGKKTLLGTQKPHELNDYLTKLREKHTIPSAGLTEKTS